MRSIEVQDMFRRKVREFSDEREKAPTAKTSKQIKLLPM